MRDAASNRGKATVCRSDIARRKSPLKGGLCLSDWRAAAAEFRQLCRLTDTSSRSYLLYELAIYPARTTESCIDPTLRGLAILAIFLLFVGRFIQQLSRRLPTFFTTHIPQ